MNIHLQAALLLLAVVTTAPSVAGASGPESEWRETALVVAKPTQEETQMRMPRVRENHKLSIDRVELHISAVKPESVYSCELEGTSRGRVVRMSLPVGAALADETSPQNLLLDPGSVPTIRCRRDVSLGDVQLEATVSGKLLAVGR